ncbi:unnamed protein product [Hymenolepis diminuta]|uniref:IMP2-like protein n=2 Tax=Hymenolepis diminuta TaxID=6216 RepID=A0A564Y0Y4_HYMDI|nr:unnamed protein product [Hymenolepis diminuta]
MPSLAKIFAYSFGASVFYQCYHFIGTIVYCEGISMEPTVRDGDYMLVERISVYLRRIKKGDIIIARQYCEHDNCNFVLKRVQAIEGDSVNYISPKLRKPVTTYIPKDHVWIEGDNKEHSLDSRTYGSIPYDELEYRVFLRLWPVTSFGWVDKVFK